MMLEFVREELDVDGVEYTVPLYAKMSELLERMRGDFADAFARERAAADEEAEADARRKASAKSRPGISPSMRSGGRKNGSQPSSPDGARDGCPTSGRTGRDANCSATRMTKSGAKPPNSFANGTTSAISTAARLLPSVRRTDSKYSCPAP